jgi:CRP-like cAMP-binding protein
MRTLFGDRPIGDNVERVAALMSDAYFDAGSTIYRRGEAAEHIYFIVSGKVVLEAPGHLPWTFGSEDGIGFQDAMQHRTHARAARAVSDVHALKFSTEDWFDLLEDHPELGRGSVHFHAASVTRMIDALGHERAFPATGAREPSGSEPPPALGAPDLVERMLMLTESELFARAGIQAVAGLARAARPVLVPAGSVLHAEGDPRAGLVLVGSGELSVSAASDGASGVARPGTLAGGLGVLASERWRATLTATESTCVLELLEDDFFQVMDDHFDLARSVFAYMSRERGRLMDLVERRKSETGPEQRRDGGPDRAAAGAAPPPGLSS